MEHTTDNMYQVIGGEGLTHYLSHRIRQEPHRNDLDSRGQGGLESRSWRARRGHARRRGLRDLEERQEQFPHRHGQRSCKTGDSRQWAQATLMVGANHTPRSKAGGGGRPVGRARPHLQRWSSVRGKRGGRERRRQVTGEKPTTEMVDARWVVLAGGTRPPPRAAASFVPCISFGCAPPPISLASVSTSQ
jgi:hypothetical protein